MTRTRTIVGLSAGTILGMLPQAASADITTPITSSSGACSGSLTLVVPDAPTSASQITARTSANCSLVQPVFQSTPQVTLSVVRYDALTPYTASTIANMSPNGTNTWQISNLTGAPDLWQARKYEAKVAIDVFPYGDNTIGKASIIRDYSPPPTCFGCSC